MTSATTICAVSTPPGRGGIAVIRVSGPKAVAVADSIWKGKPLALADSHTAHLGKVTDSSGNILDQAVATVFRAPGSFTGEDVVEISVHGSTFVQQALLESLTARGAEIAAPGEFTQRAFMNGHLDLAEAEAVADVIASSSRAAHALAVSQLQGGFSKNIDTLREQLINLASLLELELDFSEEDVEFADRSALRSLAVRIIERTSALASTFSTGSAIRNGVPVAIVGEPNAGKSSLLNALIDNDRAIVSDIPGTTRDTIEARCIIDGIEFCFIDTAGIRSTDDPIESLGIERAFSALQNARIVILLIPPSASNNESESQIQEIRQSMSPQSTLIVVSSKADINPAHTDLMKISVKTGKGISDLKSKLSGIAREGLPADESLIVTNVRHYNALNEASSELNSLIKGLDDGLTIDLLAQHLRTAIESLSSITGRITSETVLHNVFSRFCIGK